MHIRENVQLSGYTTIALGGPARWFVSCQTIEEIQQALAFAGEHSLAVHVLGGGSNTVFADEGFAGVVIQIQLSGVAFTDTGVVEAAAGEIWDSFVVATLARGWAGLECLSGIPGLVGATPMQNVGAYGQDVSEVIERVVALDRLNGQLVTFSNADCQFAYRSSCFKQADANRYIITAVHFRLRPSGAATIRYPQVAQELGTQEPTLEHVRQAVLALRRRKSMVVDSDDPNTRSCGSFFMNPIIPKQQLADLQKTYPSIPFFTGEENPTAVVSWTGSHVKIPAAWLVEQSGFSKGLRRDGVGISSNHPLALINRNGTTEQLLRLAQDVQTVVHQKFGIELAPEPVFVSADEASLKVV